MESIRDALENVSAAAEPMRGNGTILTKDNLQEKVAEMHNLLTASAQARREGADGWHIESAIAGRVMYFV